MSEANDHQGSVNKLLFFALGAVANILLGLITIYVSRLSDDIAVIETIARSGAANTALLGRDVENLTKWTIEEVRELKERLKRMETK